MRRLITLLALCLAGSDVLAQQKQFVEQLYGFMLGQFREAPANHFGIPADSGSFEDGYSYQVFHLTGKDTGSLITFEYSPELDDEIWSIEVSGPYCETPLMGVRLGDSRAEVERRLGTPQRVVSLPGNGGERWDYDSTNYVVEISTQGKLASLKIKDDSPRFYPAADPARLPKPEELYALFRTRSREKIMQHLAPDIEILDSVYARTLELPVSRELEEDVSGIFSTLSDPDYGVPALARKQPAVENMLRVSRNNVTMHVYRFKGDTPIEEIVLRYRYGRYLVWEVRLR